MLGKLKKVMDDFVKLCVKVEELQRQVDDYLVYEWIFMSEYLICFLDEIKLDVV